jgi:hypothetical protein
LIFTSWGENINIGVKQTPFSSLSRLQSIVKKQGSRIRAADAWHFLLYYWTDSTFLRHILSARILVYPYPHAVNPDPHPISRYLSTIIITA